MLTPLLKYFMGRIASFQLEEQANKKRKVVEERIQTQIDLYEECIVHLEVECMIRLLSQSGCSKKYLSEFLFVGVKKAYMDVISLDDCLLKLKQTKQVVRHLKTELFWNKLTTFY